MGKCLQDELTIYINHHRQKAVPSNDQVRKLLFLDFDGVLHPNHCDPCLWLQHMPALTACLSETQVPCGVVISSSWRFHHSLFDLVELFPPKLQEMVVGVTGDAYIGQYSRYNEIKAYLKLFQKGLEWRALDDSSWEFPSPCPQLILCDGAIGLDDSVIMSLGAWLRSPLLTRDSILTSP